MLTRQHFVSLAEVLAAAAPPDPMDATDRDGLLISSAKQQQHRKIAEKISSFLASTNPRFNQQLFLQACGVTQPD
jgi:hypothetical protein